MSDIFKIDKRDLKKFYKFLDRFPNEAKPSIAAVLNAFAFQTRENDIDNLTRSMVIRDRRFMENSLKVDKAKSGNIESMIATAYSVRRPRFSGWVEQEKGGTPAYRRGFSPAARNRNFKNKTVGKARLKPNLKFGQYTDFPIKNAKSKDQEIGVFLKIMMDRKFKSGTMKAGKQFIIPKYKGFKHGLYNYQNNRFQKYQDFDDANKPPRKTLWRTASINSLRIHDIAKIWEMNLKRIVAKYK